MPLELKQQVPEPEFNNSAGRLLALLQMLPSNASYFDTIVLFYGEKKEATPELKGRAYLEFMSLVGAAFDEFICDIDNSPRIPNESRQVIKDGLANLIGYAFPAAPSNSARKLEGAEVALLRMAGSMLESESRLDDSDNESIRNSIEGLRRLLETSDLSKSARVALLELIRLSRNALDQYTIHGARGFRAAFKKMLAELMDVYLHEGKEATEATWWSAAVAHVKFVDAVAGKLLQYQPLLENVGTLFLGSAG